MNEAHAARATHKLSMEGPRSLPSIVSVGFGVGIGITLAAAFGAGYYLAQNNHNVTQQTHSPVCPEAASATRNHTCVTVTATNSLLQSHIAGWSSDDTLTFLRDHFSPSAAELKPFTDKPLTGLQILQFAEPDSFGFSVEDKLAWFGVVSPQFRSRLAAWLESGLN